MAQTFQVLDKAMSRGMGYPVADFWSIKESSISGKIFCRPKRTHGRVLSLFIQRLACHFYGKVTAQLQPQFEICGVTAMPITKRRTQKLRWALEVGPYCKKILPLRTVMNSELGAQPAHPFRIETLPNFILLYNSSARHLIGKRGIKYCFISHRNDSSDQNRKTPFIWKP